jgi:hypothetical protein
MLWKCCKLLWGYDTSSCVLKSQDKPFLGYNNAFFSKLFSPWVAHILMSAPKFLTLLPMFPVIFLISMFQLVESDHVQVSKFSYGHLKSSYVGSTET